MSHRRRTRGRHDRGAALLEFALVVPVFLTIVMGALDFGMTFNDYNSVRQGVREGARQVVVSDWSTDGCTSGSSSTRAACVTKHRIGLDANRTRIKIRLEGDYESGDQVTVCAMYRASSITGLFGFLLDNRVLTSKVSMRLERIDTDAPLANLSEAAFATKDWSWC